MKILKKILLALFTVALLYGIGRLAVVTYDSYVFVPRMPYLQMQTQNSIMVKWQTPKAEIGSIDYANGLHVSDEKPTRYHELTLTGLKPDSCYEYKVNSSSLSIDNTNRRFCTLNTKKEMERLWVVGDTGEDSQHQKDVYNAMLSYVDNNYSKIDLWLMLGDNAYTSGTQKQYNRDLFTPYSELIKHNNIWAVIGNHDARRWSFYDIFDLPTKGESGGVASSSEKYYSIDEANFHLVMLDSETTDLSANGKMAQWLKKDLAQNKKTWTIVAFHHPPYTDATHRSDDPKDSNGRLKEIRENFTPIFDKYDVDLVMCGHSHVYERSRLLVGHTGDSSTFNPTKHVVQENLTTFTKPLAKTSNSGVIYIVDGSSSKADNGRLKMPELPFEFSITGSVVLEITPTQLSEKFITVDKEIKDSFTITKH
jgi:phosphodiesterase/alkaline phosphatase D-like protein